MGKAPKDPNAPKRPLSAYMLWAAEARVDVAESHPNYSITEIASKLGKMWKKVTAADKAEYVSQADTLKATYYKKMEKYKNSSSYKKHKEALAEFKAKEKRKPFKKDPNAPKRPMSGYMIFVSEVRDDVVSKNPDMGVTDVLKEVGSMWRDLSDSAQDSYKSKADKLKVKYEKEVKAYQTTSKYKKYQAEKEEFYAKRKADRKKEKAKLTPKKKARKAKKPKRTPSRRRRRRRSATPKAPASSSSRSRSATASSRSASSRRSRSSTSRSRASRSTSRRASRKRVSKPRRRSQTRRKARRRRA